MQTRLPTFHKFSQKLINFSKPHKDDITRLLIFILVLIVMFTLLVVRLFQLDIVKGAYYRFIAEENRITQVPIPAPRGTIKDRKAFTIAYSQEALNDKGQIARIYNAPEATSHVMGYVQIADKNDLKKDACGERIKLGDKIGKGGVEKMFECLLRGRRGKKLVEVDATGREMKVLGQIKPQEGKTIQLALDLELQKKTYELLSATTASNSGTTVDLSTKKAAVVATKPATGEILILSSTPTFNPHAFVENQAPEIDKYLHDENKPLLNRALSGTYPPGSAFKIIVATGALQEGVINESFQVEDTGMIQAGPLKFGNWYFLQYGKTEGVVDIIKGIKRSNDIFFYKVGAALGQDKIRQWALKFGLGKKTDIGLTEESGLIPSSFWKQETVGERWFLGDTYNLSIGQGYLLTTPLQINLATAAIANKGQLCKPQLLKTGGSGGIKPNCTSLKLSDKTLQLVKEGMKQACETGGTGWPFFNFPVKVGCKTGTAESHKKSGLPHALFTVFAPFEKPEIAVTVLVEESGEGSNIAAPIAKEILKSYFERSE